MIKVTTKAICQRGVDQSYSLILDGASQSQPPQSTEDADSESLIPRPNDKRSEHNDPVPPRGDEKVHSPLSKYFVTSTRQMGHGQYFLGSSLVCK